MAEFLPAFRKTVESEGLYSNDAADSGGETVLGLTVVHDPDWEGWKLVNEMKAKPGYPGNLKTVKPQLTEMAIGYYRKKYWVPVRGEEIKDQETAEEIFDFAVNTGIKQGIKTAQRAKGLKETGVMDDETLRELN